MREIWKDIPGYEGYYQVSTLGRIRSLDRVVFNSSHPNGMHLKEKLLVASPDLDRYLGVNLSKNGVRQSVKVHRLVAQTFLENPENKPEVNHKDLNKQNNRVENLEWCLRAENERHSRNNGMKNLVANKRCEPVRCAETGQMFRSISEASKTTGVSVWFVKKSVSTGFEVSGFHFVRISAQAFNASLSKLRKQGA